MSEASEGTVPVILEEFYKVLIELEVRNNYESACAVFTMGDQLLGEEYDSQLEVIQWLIDLRDPLKENSSSVILLGNSFNIPPDLKEHVAVIPAPSPTKEEYKDMVNRVYNELVEDSKDNKDFDFELTDDMADTMIVTGKRITK